ncbi:MAG: CapA family protein [Tannerella sp.]|jgi:poly-gamma-glutamate synthesis protein (capsule biosynthesis protein)|nr:CapA family protein [Tannerella sp.]
MKRGHLPVYIGCGIACLLTLCVLLLYFLRQDTDVKTDEADSPPPVRHARLVFAGDLMQHTSQINAARTSGGSLDYSESFQYVRDLFREADVAVLNFETTLTPHAPYTGYPRFRSPTQIADALSDIGIDIAALANNHICDNGLAGISFTVGYLDSCGIAVTGVFTDSLQYRARHPLRFVVDDIHFALLNYTYGTNGMGIPANTIVNLTDTATIASDLARIDRGETDCVIVFFHWGEEYARQPDSAQRMLDAFCRQRGADVIIGSHPHTIQPFEEHLDADSVVRAVTVYSLGNFVSNQRWRYSDGGLIAVIDVEKENGHPPAIRMTPVPVWVLMPYYRILPEWVADTIGMTQQQRAMYRQFAEDTHKLLGL